MGADIASYNISSAALMYEEDAKEVKGAPSSSHLNSSCTSTPVVPTSVRACGKIHLVTSAGCIAAAWLAWHAAAGRQSSHAAGHLLRGNGEA
jgi:hypothetical protein